jgi:gag-polyprotein putative aspartyl protease
MYIRSYRSLEIPFSFEHLRGKADDITLLDSGATENFMDTRTAKRLRLRLLKLNTPRVVRNVDGTENRNGSITEYVRLRVKQGSKNQVQNFYITNLGQDRTILGFPWFKTFNPTINWHTGVVEGPAVALEVPILKLINDTQSAEWAREQLKAKDQEKEDNLRLLTKARKQNQDDKLRYQWLMAGSRQTEETRPVTINECEQHNEWVKRKRHHLWDKWTDDWHIRKTTTATQWAMAAHKQKEEKPVELPTEYA